MANSSRGVAVDLTGRTVLVTGASSGIGLRTARALGRAGALVVAQYRTGREGAEAATQDLPDDRRLLVQADFSTAESATQLWQKAVAWQGTIDVVVNNAAVMPQAGLSASDEDWNRALDLVLTVNVREPLNLIRQAVRHFARSGGGVLITMSSWVAQRGSANENLVGYSASKAAVTAATKAIARAYARDGVLAYCIAPGAVETDMTIQAARTQGGEDAVRSSLAMGEFVPPHELAELVTVLASGRFRHMSGATLDVNGASYVR